MKNETADLGLIRIEASSYREALQQIGERFGKDVSIISTRQVKRKGVMGVFGTTGVEVYVTARAHHEEFLKSRALRDAPHVRKNGTTRSAQALIRRDPAAIALDAAPAGADLGRMLKELEGQVKSLLRAADPPRERPDRRVETIPDTDADETPLLREARVILDAYGFSAEIKGEFLDKIARRRVPGSEWRAEERCSDRILDSGRAAAGATELEASARRHIAELCRAKIPPCIPIQVRAGAPGPQVVALVGPTGVGKTTTIAKLASLFSLVEGKRVALLTLDTYRIGAVDQLRRFSEIMQLPLTVVEPGEGVAGAIARHRDCDLIFVDTAGRGQRDAERLADVRRLLNGVGALEVHLCVSLTTAKDTVVEVAKNFRAVPYNRVLITKLDEAVKRGVLLDLFHAAKAPVSYITCGQEVPQDIQPGSVERIEKLLLGGD